VIEPLIAGVELGGTKVICVLASGPGDVRETVHIPTTTPDESLGAVEDVLRRWTGYQALGIASFGPVSLDKTAADYGFITATTKAHWSNTDVGQRLARVANVPMGFDSDVNGAALGEGRWGAAQDVDDHAYITVGTGIGVGLVLDRNTVVGLTHPELGHVRTVRLADDSWTGSCPFHGDCVEGLASGTAIQARTGRAAQDLPADDPAWDGVTHALAQLCHTLVLTGIPKRIVFGGGVMVGIPHLLPTIRTKLIASLGGYGATTALLDPVERYVVPAALGGMAGPLGAIELGNRALAQG
jgi:fructokinase